MAKIPGNNGLQLGEVGNKMYTLSRELGAYAGKYHKIVFFYVLLTL